MARALIEGTGDSLVEARKWYGSTVSEGIYRWMYAGLSDLDYAQVKMTEPLPVPLDFDPIQNAQWAMDRLCMVYRMELQQTCDPERERELLATLSKLSRFMYETDLTDTDNLRRIIEQADRIVTHYRDTGELDGPYEVEA